MGLRRFLDNNLAVFFWSSLLLGFFTFAFCAPCFSGDTTTTTIGTELSSEKFSLVPVSRVIVTQDKEVALTFSATKLDSKAPKEKTFADTKAVEQFIDIRKNPLYGDIDFEILRCANYTDTSFSYRDECLSYGITHYPNLTDSTFCQDWKTISEPIETVSYDCRPMKDSLKLKDGEVFKIVPKENSARIVPLPSGGYGFSVWEDLFIGGEKVEGATWWNASFLYKRMFNISVDAGTTNASFKVHLTFVNSSASPSIATGYADLRFTNSSENALLDYWIENSTVAGADVWVEIDQNLTTSNYTTWAYWGNATATAMSSWDSVTEGSQFPRGSQVYGTVCRAGGGDPQPCVTGAAYSAQKTVDGLFAAIGDTWLLADTGWGLTYPQNLSIDMGGIKTINKFSIYQGTTYLTDGYDLWSSTDNSTWVYISGTANNLPALAFGQQNTTFTSFTGRYLRLRITSKQGGQEAGVAEVFSYGWYAGSSVVTVWTTDLNPDPPKIISNTTNPSSGSPFNASQQYAFCANATDDLAISSYVLDFNGTNYSATTASGIYYCYNFTGLPTGIHNFTWYVNDTGNKFNSTPTYDYAVYGATSWYAKFANGTGLAAFSLAFSNGSATSTMATTTGEIILPTRTLSGSVTAQILSYGVNSSSTTVTGIGLFSTNNTTMTVSPTLLFVKVYDELSPSTELYFNFSLSNGTTLYTDNGKNWINASFSILPSGAGQITIVNGSYVTRNYFVSITPYASVNLTAHLLGLGSGQYVRFHVTSAGGAIIGATVSAYTSINGTMSLVTQALSDTSGIALLWLNPIVDHNITATFPSCSFFSSYPLKPSSTDYYIPMTCGGTGNTTGWNYTGINVAFSPSSLIGNEITQNFTCLISSDAATITQISYSLSNATGSLYSVVGAGNGTGGLLYTFQTELNASTGELTALCGFIDSRYGSGSSSRTYFLANRSLIINETMTLDYALNATACSTYASKFTCGLIGLGTTAAVSGALGTFGGSVLAMVGGIGALGFFTYYGFFYFLGASFIQWSAFALVVFIGAALVAKQEGLIR